MPLVFDWQMLNRPSLDRRVSQIGLNSLGMVTGGTPCEKPMKFKAQECTGFEYVEGHNPAWDRKMDQGRRLFLHGLAREAKAHRV